MKCFYHNADFDGICSVAIILDAYPKCELIGVNYGDTLDIKALDIRAVQPGEKVFVVDFCFEVAEMIGLNIKADLVWIDHHISSMSKMSDYTDTAIIAGIREVGMGACALVWRFINEPLSMPYSVQLLAEYDVWNHSDVNTLPFQYGMRELDDSSVTSPIWTELFKISMCEFAIHNICETGKIIIRYESKQNKIYAKSMSFEFLLEDLRVLAINKACANSRLFDSVFDPAKHDLMMLFDVKPDQVSHSLYSLPEGPDVSKIAEIYGGGGHRNAAGFTLSMSLYDILYNVF